MKARVLMIRAFVRDQVGRSLFSLLIVWFFTANVSAEVVYKELVSNGTGINVSEAVVDALEGALSQVNGQRLSTATSLRISATQQSGVDKIEESFERQVKKATRGVIKSYTIISSGISNDGRGYAQVKAVVPVYLQSEQIKRLRLVVAAAFLSSTVANDPVARNFLSTTTAVLEAFLTQTRRFAVLDRRHSALTSKELSTALVGESAIEETVRLGSRATADYIVVIGLRSFKYESSTVSRISGKTVERNRAPLQIELRVVDIATGQIKFAQTHRNRGFIPLGHGTDRLASDVASELGEEINFAIYPAAVIALSNSHEMTINQGGQTLQIGGKYRIVELGKELIDPYTRESLGRQESDVGTVEIIRATDRMATARLVMGAISSPFKKDRYILRPVLEDERLETSLSGQDQSSPSLSKEGGGGRVVSPINPAKASDDW